MLAMALAPLSTSNCCTMVDAYHLKRTFGYWLLRNHAKDFGIFQEQKSEGVVENHINNHIH